MINWILEVEDAEDVACTVDDMDGHGSFEIFGPERRGVKVVTSVSSGCGGPN